MPVEVKMYEGNGNIKITGMIGQVMDESINVALSYIKSNYKLFDIDYNIFKSVSNINLDAIIGYHSDKGNYNFLDDYEERGK